MRKQTKINKITALFLVLAMLLTSLLTGCGGGGTSTTSAVLDKDHVYKAEYVKMENQLMNANKVFVMGEKIYVEGSLEVPTEGITGEVIIEIDPAAGEEKVLVPPTTEGGYIYTIGEGADGNICYLENVYRWDEEKPEEEGTQQYFIRTVTPSMEEVSTIEVPISDDFYPDRLVVDNQGNICLASYQMVKVYSPDGKQIYEEQMNAMDSLIKDSQGNILLTDYGENYATLKIKRMDVQAKQVTELMEAGTANSFTLSKGDDTYPVYLNDRKDVYGFNPETGEKTLLFNWLNSDINGSNIGNFAVLSDGRMVTTCYNDLTGKNEIMLLSKVDPADVKDKAIITLASVYDNYTVKNAVIAFNRENENYRIVLKDYQEYSTEENYNGGMEQFNNDLISGNIPDIINLNQLNVNTYASKGLLEDLYPWMEKDETFNRGDYMENIFAACENDGKLYELVPSFTAYTVVGKSSNVGENPGWTMEDMEAAYKKLPEGAKIFTDVSRETVLLYADLTAAEQFIDYKEGVCHYDDGEFAKLLEFVNQFPSDEELYGNQNGAVTMVEEVDMNEGQQGYRKNKILLQFSYIYNYNDVHQMKYETYGGEDITFVGFPTANKNGSGIMPELELAMSSKSANKEGVWEFFKFFLSDEYQESIQWGWPVKKNQMERLKEEAQTPDYYLDENGKKVEMDNTIYLDGKEVNIGKISDEEVKKVDEFLSSLNQLVRYDQKVTEIIKEETQSYFAGQKSADEVCKLIQNRVQTYLSETR